MYPTLEIGDHIFVNKFIYGVRIPWTMTKLFELRRPEARRGDRVHLSVRAGPRLHQARDRDRGRDRRGPLQRRLRRRRRRCRRSSRTRTARTSTRTLQSPKATRDDGQGYPTRTRKAGTRSSAAVRRDRRRQGLRHVPRPRAPGSRAQARAGHADRGRRARLPGARSRAAAELRELRGRAKTRRSRRSADRHGQVRERREGLRAAASTTWCPQGHVFVRATTATTRTTRACGARSRSRTSRARPCSSGCRTSASSC